MTTYINVGVTQIQSWLDRSPDLRGRRGASSMLAEATAQGAWANVPGASWNSEAGAVSGIVALKLDPGADPQSVARDAARALRRRLPAALITGSWAEAASYVEAYPALLNMQATGGGIESLPPTTENVLGARCAQCAIDVAVAEAVLPGNKLVRICRDCAERYAHAGTNRERARQLKTVIGWMEESGKIADDMRELAAVGHHRDRDLATRVATFYADGNAVGKFIKDSLGAGVNKTELAARIDDANVCAFRTAARRVEVGERDQARHAVVPHIVAGDDVLVSVSAPKAWDFAATFLASFAAEIAASARLVLPKGARVTLPSASGALVFHHASSPLPDAIAEADDLLRWIKHETAEPSLGYLDLMAETRGLRRKPMPVAWVVGHLDVARTVAALPANHRKRLAPLLRRATTADAADVERAVVKSGASALAGRDMTTREWLIQIAGDIEPSEQGDEEHD